jgi:transposase-like protein
VHRNAPLTPDGRLQLCQRIEDGWPVAHAAASMSISRDRAYVWWRRYQEEGIDGLEDRSSRPHHSPNQLKRRLERRVVSLRRNRGLGPARIAGIVGLHASTTHRVLVRHGLNRLDHLERLTREPIRRFEMKRPGELVHVDIKKLGRIPKGGGWRAHGRSKRKRAGTSRRARSTRRRRRALPPKLTHSFSPRRRIDTSYEQLAVGGLPALARGDRSGRNSERLS